MYRGEYRRLFSYTESNYTYSDNPSTLPADKDAATASWGSGWRMPTQAELDELKSYYTMTWNTRDGVNGFVFVGSNGNSIFLPGTGNTYGSYWSSSLFTGNQGLAWCFRFGSDYYECYTMGNMSRYHGYPVRPVVAE